MSTGVQCHPTAVVQPGAELGTDVNVGPYAIIDAKAEIGDGCRIDSFAVVDAHTRLGAECQVFPHACLGSVPQDQKFAGELSYLEVGERNIIREFVTMSRGTAGGGGCTRIGSDNLFMAYTHIAHDCRIGDHTIFGNAATLAGHVVVEDHVSVAAFSGIQQYCRIGEHAFLAAYSGVTKDVVPYALVEGNHCRVRGLNSIGLRRRDFSAATRSELKRCFRLLFRFRVEHLAGVGVDRDGSVPIAASRHPGLLCRA